MKNKITLITPPDFFENSSFSLLLLDITDADQITVTNWLSKSDQEKDLNLYFYSQNKDAKWMLSAFNKADLVFVDLDNLSPDIVLLAGYLLSNPKVFFQSRKEENVEAVKFINTNQVPDVRYFLDEVLLAKFLDK